ncbi:MAG: HAMP domain-containing protein [Sulfuricella sp.]|nr:HAMP domain-containing protein [Sulfuricella sp.]
MAMLVHGRLKAEIDHRLDQEIEIVERSLILDPGGQVAWHTPHEQHEAYQPLRNVSWLDIHRLDGTTIYRLPETDMPGMDTVITPFEATRVAGYFSFTTANGTRLRALQRDIEISGRKAIARAALSEEQGERDLRTLYWVMGLGLPLAIVVSLVGGYLLAGRALRPITEMVAEARAIHAERLDTRLPVANPNDEIGRLAATFNDLFARLENSFAQLKRFTADASHELRTPLAVIRSVGEVGLRESHDEAAYREIIASMLEEADRLTLMVESLLTLTRADTGLAVQTASPLDLAEMAEQVVAHLRVLSEEKGQEMTLDTAGSVPIMANPSILRLAVINLLDNAIKYAPPAGRVVVRASRNDTEAILEVADSGSGIPPEHQERIFERFYRTGAARDRAAGGFGLGLAVARWAVETHGGQVKVAASSSRGSVFRIVLPLRISPLSED